MRSAALATNILSVIDFDWRLNKKLVLAVFSAAIMLLLMFYIFQINSLTAKSYSLQSYQKKINNLGQENEKLEMELAHAGSLVNIESMTGGLEFEKITKINYVQIMENSMAAAK